MDWHEITHALNAFMGQWSGAVGALVVVIAALIATAILHQILKYLIRRAGSTGHIWREAILAAVSTPLLVLVWVIGIAVSVEALTDASHSVLITRVLLPARNIAIILIIAWFMLRALTQCERNLDQHARIRGHELDSTATDAISKLLRAAIVVLTVIVILEDRGVSIAGILAFGGVGGIALGFAAQSLVANLLGGLTIYSSRIFKIGEDIILTQDNLSGTVEHIGWRATRVLGWNGKPFYIPNAYFNTSTMINNTRLERRLISEDILLRYEDFDKIPAIVRDSNEALAKRDDLNYFAFRFDSFGNNALKLNLYAWPQTVPGGKFMPYAEFARVKEEILLSIAAIAQGYGCKLILPISHLYLGEKQDSASFQLPEDEVNQSN